MNGKGSQRRPTQVSAQQLEDNWRRTFGSDSRADGNDRARVRNVDASSETRSSAVPSMGKRAGKQQQQQ